MLCFKILNYTFIAVKVLKSIRSINAVLVGIAVKSGCHTQLMAGINIVQFKLCAHIISVPLIYIAVGRGIPVYNKVINTAAEFFTVQIRLLGKHIVIHYFSAGLRRGNSAHRPEMLIQKIFFLLAAPFSGFYKFHYRRAYRGKISRMVGKKRLRPETP